jgi:hypothetical protein
MANNININLDAKTSHLVWGLTIQQVFQFLPFLFLFVPAMGLGLWMFGNFTKSVERQAEFDQRVQACTADQYRTYGYADSYACKKSVNAVFRVYENL